MEAQYFDKLLSEQNEEQDESKESSEAKSSKVAEERTKAKVATTVDLKERNWKKLIELYLLEMFQQTLSHRKLLPKLQKFV